MRGADFSSLPRTGALLDIPYQGIGVLARRGFIAQSPEVAEKTLRALVKAIVYFQDPTNKKSVTGILARWLRLQRIEDAEAGYEMIKGLYDRRIFPTREGLLNTQRVLSKVDQKFSRLKVEDIADDRIVRKLEREGVFK